jgi:hypothetical protein
VSKNKKAKKPIAILQPSGGKQPRTAEDPDKFHQQRAAWRLRRMKIHDPFGWHAVDGETLLEIRTKLSSFETMTWAEIFVAAKKQNHAVDVAKLCPMAVKELKREAPDIDHLHSLRLSGRQRVWGILSEGVFHVLWWDPNHQVCPSLLDHT